MIKGIAVRPGGAVEEVELRVLDDYRDIVEGSIEAVFLHLADDRDKKHVVVMYVNDSFLLGQFDLVKDFNEVATGLAYVGGRQELHLLGSVLIVGGPTHEGDDTAVPQTLVYKWLGRIKYLQAQMNSDRN